MSPIAWLLERFEACRDDAAILRDGDTATYGDLVRAVRSVHASLDEHGVAPGTVTALVGDYSAPTCATLLALIERLHVVVPLVPPTFRRHPEFLETAEVQTVLHVDDEDPRVTRRDVEPRNPLTTRLMGEGRPGLVLFSSGSTGTSKAALHDLTRLLAKFRRRRRRHRAVTFLLLDHIGGLNTLFHVLSSGGAVVALRERSPGAVCEAIQRHRVTLLPASPTFLNLLLLSEEYRRFDLSSLERITYGTEPMPEGTLRRLHTVFPGVDLQQTYGLSELGILRSKSRASDSLWVRLGGEGFQLKVVDGILWVRAESSMLGYLNAPSPFDDAGWFCTGDVVEVDGEYLRIHGRQSEIINVGGEKVFPSEVESVLLEQDNIRDAMVYGEANPITGQIVVALVNTKEPEDAAALRARVRRACRERLAPFKVPQKVVATDEQQFNERFKKLRRR